MNTADEERFTRLVDWSRSHGGRLNDAVEVYRDNVTKLSLRVKDDSGSSKKHDLNASDAVAVCPLSTTLSYLNILNDGRPLGKDSTETSSADSAFPDEFVEDVAPHVLGRFFLMQQYLRGQKSPWHPYIATLPQPEHLNSWNLPALWPRGDDGDQYLLEGTNAGVAADEMRERVSAEFKQARRILKRSGWSAWPEYTRLLYNWAFCIFTSRSFRPSLVLAEDVQAVLLGKDKGDESQHGKLEYLPQLPEDCKIDDFSILLPVLDLANHDPRAKVSWETKGGDNASVSFCVQQTYQSGAQVFNNYGMKTNSELLLGYGFVLPPTEALHNDYVHLRKRDGGGDDAADEESDDDEDAAVETAKKQEFLISLRSVDDPSSVVGAARRWRQPTPTTTIRPGFSLFQDGLLWEIVAGLVSEEERNAIGQKIKVEGKSATEMHAHAIELVFGQGEDDTFASLREKVRSILLAKVGADYERLCEEEVEDEGPEADNANQQLARQYREQTKAVLENALGSLQ